MKAMKIFGKILIALTAVVIMSITGCGSGNTPASTQNAATPGTTPSTSATAKGLAVNLNFGKSSRKSVKGGGLPETSTNPTIRDRSPEVQALVSFITVQVNTETGFPVGTYPLQVQNGEVVGGNLPLNVGRYQLFCNAFSSGSVYLYHSPTLMAEVFADGHGEATIDLESEVNPGFQIRINKLPGKWHAETSTNVPYQCYQTDIYTRSASLEVQSESTCAEAVYDGDPINPATTKSLRFEASLWLKSTLEGSFNPTVSFFFKTFDDDGLVHYGEYAIDIIEAIKAIDRDGYLSFDYAKQGSLTLGL